MPRTPSRGPACEARKRRPCTRNGRRTMQMNRTFIHRCAPIRQRSFRAFANAGAKNKRAPCEILFSKLTNRRDRKTRPHLPQDKNRGFLKTNPTIQYNYNEINRLRYLNWKKSIEPIGIFFTLVTPYRSHLHVRHVLNVHFYLCRHEFADISAKMAPNHFRHANPMHI